MICFVLSRRVVETPKQCKNYEDSNILCPLNKITDLLFLQPSFQETFSGRVARTVSKVVMFITGLTYQRERLRKFVKRDTM